MAKILFINPVIRQNERPSHIPYGMAQLAALCVKNDHKVQVFDANAWRPKDSDICEVIGLDTWNVIAIGGLVTTYGFIKKTLKLIKKICPKALIIAGGGFISPIPFDVMKFLPEIDIGVIGEGYITLMEVLEKADSGIFEWNDVRGIIYREDDGRLVLTGERPLLDDMDSIPFPAWDLFPLDIYFQNSSLLLSEEAMLAKRHLGVLASYGCPNRCKYCFHLGLSGEISIEKGSEGNKINITSKRYVRFHSPEYVVSMIADARKRYKIDFVSFLDENFAVLGKKNKWFNEFRNLWIKEGLQPQCIKEKKNHDPEKCKGIHWGTTAHAAIVNERMLNQFKELGCSHLDYGIESFSDDILLSIDKKATAKMNESAVIATMKAGIRPIPNQIIGFPEESFESLRSNVSAWKRLGICAYPFLATPYPGSEWYFTYKKDILSQYDGNLEAFLLDLGDATKITAVISKRFNAVELLGLRELMVNMDIKRINEYEKMKQ